MKYFSFLLVSLLMSTSALADPLTFEPKEPYTYSLEDETSEFFLGGTAHDAPIRKPSHEKPIPYMGGFIVEENPDKTLTFIKPARPNIEISPPKGVALNF